MKMADVDPFGEHDKTDAQPHKHPDESIPFTPGGIIEGGSTWEPECKQETSSKGKTQKEIDSKKCSLLYQKLSEKTGQTPEAVRQ